VPSGFVFGGGSIEPRVGKFQEFRGRVAKVGEDETEVKVRVQSGFVLGGGTTAIEPRTGNFPVFRGGAGTVGCEG
jgi:hypothetical protein